MDKKIINPRNYKTISKDKKKKKDKTVKKNMEKSNLISNENIFSNKTLKNTYSNFSLKDTTNESDERIEYKDINKKNQDINKSYNSNEEMIFETQQYFKDKIKNIKNKKELKIQSIEKTNIEDNIKENKKIIKSEILNDIKYKKDINLIYDDDLDKISIKKDRRKNKTFNKILKLVCLTIVLFIIYILSQKVDDIEILSVFSSNEKENIVENLEFSIGINNIDLKENIVINELKHYSYKYLLTIDTNYDIHYELLSEVYKIENNVYNLKIKDSKYTKNIINELNINKDKLNILSIDKTNENNLIVNLNKENPYFVYALKDIHIENSDDKFYESLIDLAESKFIRKNNINNKELVNKFKVLNYTDVNLMIEEFKKDYIQMVLTSSEDEINLIGRHDYNIGKYRSGENYFLIFNKQISNLDLRKSIIYAINRKNIVNEISNSFSEIIDIPYIYSDVLYKYDNIAAENILIKNGYKKESGIYTKDNKPLIFDLVVNVNDKQKNIIADNIKEMLSKIGIKVNIVKLNNEELHKRVKNKEYDLILATINLNESADITYLYEYININDNINNAILAVNNSDVANISDNVRLLMNTIYNEIGCFGILAKTTGVIYNKNIQGISNEYMNLFKDIENIIKVIE